MDSKSLIRWSGLAMIVGGLLYLPIPVRSWIEARVAEPYQSVLTIELALWQSRLVVQKFFLLFGFFGIFAHQLANAGRLGLVAFVLASVGNVALAGATMINLAMDPPLVAAGHPILGCMGGYAFRDVFVDPSFPCESARLGARYFWTLSALAVVTPGTALLGIAIARARVLPRGAGILIAVGWTSYPFSALLPGVLVGALMTTVAVGYAWCGWAMWTRPDSHQRT
jgi:hypothetical protein